MKEPSEMTSLLRAETTLTQVRTTMRSTRTNFSESRFHPYHNGLSVSLSIQRRASNSEPSLKFGLGVWLLALTFCSHAWANEGPAPTMTPRVKLMTNRGDIVLELDAEKAPASTLNFVQYVQDRFYDGTIFHRVVKDFMIQGGGLLPTMEEKKTGLREPIPLESHNGLSNMRGSVAMARKAHPHTATAQFFINTIDNRDKLDYKPTHGLDGYAVFGKVVEGMDVVDKIQNTELAMHPQFRTREGAVTPTDPVVIEGVLILAPLDIAKATALASTAAASRKKAEEEAQRKAGEAIPDRIKKIEAQVQAPMINTGTGLLYVDLRIGQGATPQPSDDIEVIYRGTFADGAEFDSSSKNPMSAGTSTFNMRKLNRGWQEGLLTMREGGKRILVVPSELGYGKEGMPGIIPPDSTLFYEVELLQVKPASQP
jgi:cyclophilin family peptidyl-prolyl cis-trans isomerase